MTLPIGIGGGNTDLPGDWNKKQNPPDINQAPAIVQSQKERLQRKYGIDFPDLTSTNGPDWRRWIEGQRKKQEPIMRDKRLHWSRHRHFRAGHQWISTRDGRLWREPQSDVNDVRPVLNIIGPALDFRLGILSEQRPGFRHEPIGGGVAGREAAEAQQAVSEYYFYVQRAWNLFLDAWFHAQTDGVSFIHVFVDKTAGPSRDDLDLIPETDERYRGLQAQGYNVRPDGLLELPYPEEGVVAPPGTPARVIFEGELSGRVLLAHEVLFDPEARSVNGPTEPRARWALVRRMRDVQQARLETGDPSIESEMVITSQSDVLDMPIDRSMGWQRGLPPFPTRRQRIIDGVPEYLLWLAPDQHEPGLELGRWMRIVGNVIVDAGDELPGGVIQHARFFAGGRMLAPKNTILEETYSNIIGSFVEYQGVKPDVVNPVAAGPDAWRLLDWLIKKLEDKTGWSDIARGQMSQTGSAQDVSGRAVLASQQLFERTFGPSVRAAAEGATEWAHLVVRYAQWLFDEPRLIPAVGGRGDLAKSISSEKLGDRPMVYVDPETLMPMPRALRQQLLEDQLDKGRITLATYQRRSVYADVRDLPMGDMDQWQRAQWINTLLSEKWEEIAQMETDQRYTAAVTPVFWQDDVHAHKMCLMEIVLDERKPWGLRSLCLERWGIYDQLERAQQDPTGQTQIPAEILGVPMDKIQTMPPPDVPGPASPMGPQGAPPGGTGVMNAQVPLTSPAPTNSPVLPEASKQSAPALGQLGGVEAAAMREQA